ncbi:MAG: signal peptidase II [Gammaproteobacteria bacterium]|nr:signal peptidase II [Gammaproteobacteria bacterium]
MSESGFVRPRAGGLRWLWLTGAVLVSDQLSKAWIVATLSLYERIPLLPFLDITRVHNRGAAFSFLSSAAGWQRWFFTALALAVSVAILLWLRRLPREQRGLAAGLALVLGGALGNVWDRLQFGYVVDFIDVYYGSWHWPAFNVADSAISIGAVLLILDALATRKKGGV